MTEQDQIRQRIGQLRALLLFVSDTQALKAINDLISEATEQLERLVTKE